MVRVQYDPDKHHRQSIRLKGYDYAQAGAYFVRLCAQERACLFGEVADGGMRVNPYGQVVLECWDDLVNHYPHIALDAFVVMPNHVHGIIALAEDVGAGFKPAPTGRRPLSEIVRAFKTFSARRINQMRNTPGTPV
jgi:putative transposase